MSTRISIGAVAAMLAGAACSSHTSSATIDAGSDLDAGVADAGPSWSTPVAIDTSGDAGLDLTVALDPMGHAAAAYFVKTAPARYTLTLARDDGSGNWTTEAVPIAASPMGALDSLPQLTGHYGVALAFDPQGEAVIALLAGGNADDKTGGDGRWTSFEGNANGDSLPSDAVIMTQTASGWSTDIVAQYSNDIVATGFQVDDKGVVTGLWAGLAIDPTGVIHAAFRDIHYGSDMSATSVSNLEYYEGDSSGNKLNGEIIGGGRCDPLMLSGAGNYTHMVLANGEPAVSFTLDPMSTDGVAQVWFAQRTSSPDAGTADAGADDGDTADAGEPQCTAWSKVQVSAANGEIGQGPSLAYSEQAGFAIAYYDADEQDLVVSSSSDGATWTPNTWDAYGNTGQYPAAAFDSSGNLGVLYALCSLPTDTAGSCSSSQELLFRLNDGPEEHIGPDVPVSSTLIVDGSGRFIALYGDPNGGLYYSVRTP